MRRILSSLLIILLLSINTYGQSSGTPSTLRVRVDANGYLVVTSATQTSPVTSGTFNSRVLKTDASGNLLVVNTGGASGPVSYVASTCAAPGISLTGAVTNGIAFTVTPSILNCIAGVAVTTLTGSSFTSTVPVLVPDGSAAAPSYSFASAPTTGIYSTGVSQIAFAISGTQIHRFDAVSYWNISNSARIDFGSAADVSLFRDAANTLAQRNGTNAQTFNLYGSYTDGSNYYRANIGADTSGGWVGTDTLGTGVGKETLRFVTGGTSRWKIDPSGHLLAWADNTYDIGASGASRPRNGYFGNTITADAQIIAGTNLFAGGSSRIAWTSSSRLIAPSDGIVQLANAAETGFTRLILGTNNASGVSFVKDGVGVIIADGAGTAGAFLAGVEQTAPAAPSANGYRIYAQDNGAGKTQLCALFNSGVAQCFATEP